MFKLPPFVSNLSGCWWQMMAMVPYTAFPMSVCRTALSWWHGTYFFFLPSLLSHILYAAFTLDGLTWYCICLCRLSPAFLIPSSNSHPSFLQGVTSCRLSPRLSIVFPVWWPTAFFCPRMHKSGISHDKPSCPKTLYILSDLPVMKRFSFSSHFRAVDIHFPVQS